MAAGDQWDWPNQQVVRPDESGPGSDTPRDASFEAVITHGHAGLSYEFLLKLITGDPVTGHGPADWDFGDGGTQLDVETDQRAAHTYAAEGTYTVTATVGTSSVSTTIATDGAAGGGTEEAPAPSNDDAAS